jgi:hypothetical protein
MANSNSKRYECVASTSEPFATRVQHIAKQTRKRNQHKALHALVSRIKKVLIHNARTHGCQNAAFDLPTKDIYMFDLDNESSLIRFEGQVRELLTSQNIFFNASFCQKKKVDKEEYFNQTVRIDVSC